MISGRARLAADREAELEAKGKGASRDLADIPRTHHRALSLAPR